MMAFHSDLALPTASSTLHNFYSIVTAQEALQSQINVCQCKPIRLQKCNKRYVTQQCTKEPVIFQALELDESQCEYCIFCFAFKSKNISMSYLEFTEGTPKKKTKLLLFFLLLFFFFFF